MSVYEFRHTESPAAAAAWTRRQIILTDLRSVGGRAYPRISGMLREPSWLFFEILLPFLATSAFVFVYRALQAPPQYIGFVVLGGALTSFWLNVVWMMAGQLYWEKAQGNLELFFAAPMGFMAILFGMALGGMVMSSTRAVVVLLVSTLVYGVTFDVQQPLLLVVIFLLTLTALYGLGMIMASLYLVWGREAFQLNQLFVEPVYFVSGLNFPVMSLGLHRGDGARHDPAGRRPRRDAPAGVRRLAVPGRHAIGRGRGADPASRCRSGSRWPPATPWPPSSAWPAAKAASRSDGSDRRRRGPHAGRRWRRASSRPSGAASTRHAPRSPRSGETWRGFRAAVSLGWKMEANWTDPFLFFVYSVAKPVSAALILVVMLEIIAGTDDPEFRSFVVVGLGALVDGPRGHRRARVVRPRRSRALPDAQVHVRQPGRLHAPPARSRRRAGRGRGDGRDHHDRRRHRRCSACRSTSRPWTGSASCSSWSSGSPRSWRSGSCSPPSASRPARSRGRTRRPWPARCSSSAAPCSRSRSCRSPSRPWGSPTR